VGEGGWVPRWALEGQGGSGGGWCRRGGVGRKSGKAHWGRGERAGGKGVPGNSSENRVTLSIETAMGHYSKLTGEGEERGCDLGV